LQIIFSSFFSNGGLAVSLVSAAITMLAQINGIISVTLPRWLETVGWRVFFLYSFSASNGQPFFPAGLVFECAESAISSGLCVAATGEQLLDTFSIAPTGTGAPFCILLFHLSPLIVDSGTQESISGSCYR
jgi:hypothetical protein